MIVRMYRGLRAELSSKHLNGTVSYHFINIHVGLGARARLPYHQWKVIIQLPTSHL